jgi:hypothetical protein
MNRRRIFIVAACIALIFVLAALIWVDINENQRITNLEATVTNLGNRVTALESETWHYTGNYTLSQSATTVSFGTQGKAWRMTYVFEGAGVTMLLEYNLRVLDSNGNIVGGLGGIELSNLENSGRGTLFIPEAKGTYSVEIIGIISGDFTFSFEVDSYY